MPRSGSAGKRWKSRSSRAESFLTPGPTSSRRFSRRFVAINDSLSFPQRFQRFLYSPGNIAGCLLAMGGLGLFFGGVIQAYWWAIVPGLYGVGALAWPRND